MLKRQRPPFGISKAAFRPFKAPRRTGFIATGLPVRRRRQQARIGGFTGIEKKFVDYTVSSDAFTTIWAGGEMDEGTALSMSSIGIGTGESQRDGRIATLHSWFIKGFVTIPVVEGSVTPLGDILARIAIVLDKQTNGAQLSAEDVFDTVGTPNDVNSVKNLQNSARFVVLKDKTILISRTRAGMNEGQADLFAAGAITVPFKMGGVFKPPIRVNHTGTTAVVASIADNSLHVIGTAQSTGVLLTYRTRVRFTG